MLAMSMRKCVYEVFEEDQTVPENDEKAAQLVGEIFKPTPNKARVVDLKTA